MSDPTDPTNEPDSYLPPAGAPQPSWSTPPPPGGPPPSSGMVPAQPWGVADKSPKRTQILIVTIFGFFCCGLLWIWSLLDSKKERESYPQDDIVTVCYWISVIGLIIAVGAFVVWLGFFALTAVFGLF